MKNICDILERQIRARYNEKTIIVYQAYNKDIAENAVINNAFVFPFKTDRMTWIKPSFFWMMYRSGWATKKNQEHILEIKIKIEGFEKALKNACLSNYNSIFFKDENEWEMIKKNSIVTIQWDPERDIFLNKLNYRSIQIGLSRNIVNKYIIEWIVEINDITQLVHKTKYLIDAGKIETAKKIIPVEKVYEPLFKNKNWIGMI